MPAITSYGEAPPLSARVAIVVPIAMVAVVLIWLTNLSGWWWTTPLTGVVLGLVPWRGGLTAGVSASVGALGWGLGLIALAFQQDVSGAAGVTAAFMGFGRHGSIVIALTLLLAAVLCLAGAWVGASLRRLFTDLGHDPFGQF